MADTLAHHRLGVHRTLGSLRLDVELALAAPWTLIFGPSGSGKSSLLRAASGLVEGEGVTFERRGAAGEWQLLSAMASRERALGYAPQSPTLFPHLNVEANVAFAVESRIAGSGKCALVAEALKMFELQALTRRLPRELSGGERQRVNLARAFAVPDAKLMLLDEPFSGVDHAMRDALVLRMQQWLGARALPVISVSHDVDEALLLRAEVLVLAQGSVRAQGPAAAVLCDERTRMLAVLQQA